MNLTQTFSVSAIIIGIYILFSYLFSYNTDSIPKIIEGSSPYHIGCYLKDHNTTHYHHIQLTLKSLETESQVKLSR